MIVRTMVHGQLKMAGILLVAEASYYKQEVMMLSNTTIFLCRESISQFGQQKKWATIMLGLVMSRENVSENMGTGFPVLKFSRSHKSTKTKQNSQI